MNNADLAEVLASGNGLTKTDARKYVDAVFATIADAAAKGEEVSLNGFGKFKVKATPAREGGPLWPSLIVTRTGGNPATGFRGAAWHTPAQ